LLSTFLRSIPAAGDSSSPIPSRGPPLSSTPAPLFPCSRPGQASRGAAWGISVPSPWGPRGNYGRGASEDPSCRVAVPMEPQHGHPRDRVHDSHVLGSVHHRPRSVVHPTIRLHVSGDGARPVG